MSRPSKKEIKLALDKLRDSAKSGEMPQHLTPKLEDKKGNTKIRKKGAI